MWRCPWRISCDHHLLYTPGWFSTQDCPSASQIRLQVRKCPGPNLVILFWQYCPQAGSFLSPSPLTPTGQRQEGGSFKPSLQANGQVMSMLPWPQGCRDELHSPNLAQMLAASNHLSILLQGLLHRKNLDFPDFQHLIFRFNLRAKCGSRSTDGNAASVMDTRQTLLLP